ncbi:MAG: DUF438 domain-containing protein [Clostridiaceae bacterium]|nr:DUF438 domain-containing protein [Clostridiaceae bacterium]
MCSTRHDGPEDRAAVAQLVAYLQGLLNQEPGRQLYERYQAVLDRVTPRQALRAYHQLYEAGTPVADLLDILDKSINAFHRALKATNWPQPDPAGFAGYLLQENAALLARLDAIRHQIMHPENGRSDTLLSAVIDLQTFAAHYTKKENILFPFLERKAPYFKGLGIMWALHDEIRRRLKQARQCLDDPACAEQERSVILGKLLFGLHGMVFKEELILLPEAMAVLKPAEWDEMLRQCTPDLFPYIENPPQAAVADEPVASEDVVLQTATGSLTAAQIEQIFAALPVDMTLVDGQDKVRFFSRPKERIFPRSQAIIGRQVANCHPPQSVDKVLAIVAAFRQGREDQATFWIQHRGRFILIQYFALRRRDGVYLGTLEVSQDITGLRQLEGERRLLDWPDEDTNTKQEVQDDHA